MEKIFQRPIFYLPKEGVDLQKWAVIACDQFTSQPEYWEEVEKFIGDSPSTYNLILPEAYLNTPKEEEHLRKIHASMHSYLAENILTPYEGFVYIERFFGMKMRRGLLLNIDLDHYDFTPASQSLIRASEETVLDRLPLRIKIRENALLEIPHVMVLVDDRSDELFSFLAEGKKDYKKIYDFNLMQNSGSIKGYLINRQAEAKVFASLNALIEENEFKQKYALSANLSPLLFVVGDGNHSVAAAKAMWEKIKKFVPVHHPARYAMVEVVNIHDKSLDFKPIHRLLANFS